MTSYMMMISLKNGDHAIIEFDCGCKINYKCNNGKITKRRRWCHTDKCELIRPTLKPEDFRDMVKKIAKNLDQC